MIKRAFDVMLAAGAMLVLIPFFLVIALLLKMEGPGSIFFRQVRVGWRGREFRIYKFRTMRDGSQASGLQITVGDDLRITRWGKMLRKYKIDELPQLINVLCGDMSIVGPRPEVPRYQALYPQPTRDVILSVRPGITDLAAIEFREENAMLGRCLDPERTYVDEIMPIKARYYVEYVKSRTLWLDIAIVWKTIRALVGMR